MTPGMLVCLKSGGPTMTIETIEPNTEGKVVCVRFQSGSVMREKFSLHALRLVEQPK